MQEIFSLRKHSGVGKAAQRLLCHSNQQEPQRKIVDFIIFNSMKLWRFS